MLIFWILFFDEVVKGWLLIDDELVKEVRDILLALCGGSVKQHFVARAFIEMKFGWNAEPSVHLVKFFDALRVVANHIVRAREHCDCSCWVEFCKVFLAVEF